MFVRLLVVVDTVRSLEWWLFAEELCLLFCENPQHFKKKYYLSESNWTKYCTIFYASSMIWSITLNFELKTMHILQTLRILENVTGDMTFSSYRYWYSSERYVTLWRNVLFPIQKSIMSVIYSLQSVFVQCVLYINCIWIVPSNNVKLHLLYLANNFFLFT